MAKRELSDLLDEIKRVNEELGIDETLQQEVEKWLEPFGDEQPQFVEYVPPGTLYHLVGSEIIQLSTDESQVSFHGFIKEGIPLGKFERFTYDLDLIYADMADYADQYKFQLENTVELTVTDTIRLEEEFRDEAIKKAASVDYECHLVAAFKDPERLDNVNEANQWRSEVNIIGKKELATTTNGRRTIVKYSLLTAGEVFFYRRRKQWQKEQ